jgi:cystathionine beta-lyase
MIARAAPRGCDKVGRQGGHWPIGTFAGMQPGIFNAATVLFPNMAAYRARDWTRKDQFIYGPHGTPTTFELEEKMARLEGAQHCLLCPSGLNAIALTYIGLLRPGDELMVPVNVYAANRAFINHELQSWGIRVRLYDPTDIENLEIHSETQLIWIEAPCSITFEFPDVPAIVSKARAAGLWTALDSTWSAGVAFRAFDLGIDIAIQSLSKFANGSGDTFLGSISCNDKVIYDLLKLCAMRLGLGVSGADAASVLKGLPTLSLRYRAQDMAARYLAQRLHGLPGIHDVLHPSLEHCVGHSVWRRDCAAAAGILSIVFDDHYTQAQIDDFIDALALFKIGYGWGGPISLVMSCGRSIPSIRPLRGELVRLSVGLESPEDQLADILQALETLGAAKR